jgi:starch synthase
MRVLFAASEFAPFVKTGGLGDVCASLPPALARLDVDVRVLLPAYPSLMHAFPDALPVGAVAATPIFPGARILEARTQGRTTLWLVESPALFDRAGGPYQDPYGLDWPDNALRFGQLSRVAAELCGPSGPEGWRADILHCSDWQTGLAPALLRFAGAGSTRTILTIHNLAYQGIFPPATVAALALPAWSFSIEGLEYYGNLSFLKAGIYYADAITTVSPTYALEIQSPPLGMGLHGLLATRSASLHGILNGIDTGLWDPGADAAIAAQYGPETLARKKRNKAALQRRMGLDADPETPLAAIVSRFTHQKGIDLVLDAADRLLAMPLQLALLGSGDHILEAAVRQLAGDYPGSVAATIGFDEDLAHLMEAGADVFLMPSRFEPCGMNQMYSQRYGTPPVARATGGLVDSIVDVTPESLADGTGAGFLFAAATPAALVAAVSRAVDTLRHPRLWRRVQRAGMARDFSWDASALAYVRLYRELAAT